MPDQPTVADVPASPRRRRVLVLVPALVAALLATGCSSGSPASTDGDVTSGAPDRITIVPDDYHVPYAGTAEDGRRFFLSDELFADGSSYVGLFLWQPDGTFDEVQVDPVPRPAGLPPGQAGPADRALLATKAAALGDYVLEPITVEPFLQEVDGVTFGWKVEEYDDEFKVSIEPGNFIAYYEPWDGLEYDS